jgi:hypothetical protein
LAFPLRVGVVGVGRGEEDGSITALNIIIDVKDLIVNMWIFVDNNAI